MKKFFIVLLALMLSVSTALADTVPYIETKILPSGAVLWHYSEKLSATGTGPIEWLIVKGELPQGLTLTEEGMISGTPQRIETKNFTVQATNSVGYDRRNFSIKINKEPVSNILSGGGCTSNSNKKILGVISLIFMGMLIKNRRTTQIK